MVGDDYGHSDLGYHGGDIKTPNMDKWSALGVRLESFYTQPICAATRSSILTGRYVQRLGYQHNNPPKSFGGVGGIPLGEKLLGQYMRDAGYATHHVGKWHGGMLRKEYFPTNRGFDTSFGYYEGAIDYYDHTIGPAFLDLHAGTSADPMAQECQPLFNGTYDMDMFTDRALSIVDEHPDRTRSEFTKPFFMYLAFHSVHAPDECSQFWYDQFGSFPDTDNRRTMCGQVSAMDASVGRILEHWQRAKSEEFWQNSFFFFHGDNGGPTYPTAGTNNYRK